MTAQQSTESTGLTARIRHFFLAVYEGNDLIDRKQAESLLYTLFAMAAGTLIISLVMTDKTAAIAIFCIAILSASFAFLVKAGRAKFVSAATTFLLSLSFAGLSFIEPYSDPYELYLLTALQGFILMITGIVARRSWQSLGVMAIAIAALALDFFLRLVPAGRFSINIDDYVICNVVIVISAFIGRAPQQVDEFLAEAVAPIRKRYANVLGQKSELKV